MVARAGEPMSEYEEKSDHEKTALIRDDVERTRMNMSRTALAIEERLSPAHIKEQVADIKQPVLGEYHEAKDHLKEDISHELREAKEKVQVELREAKEKVQEEIREARMAVREATVGKVEHMDRVAQLGSGSSQQKPEDERTPDTHNGISNGISKSYERSL